MTSLVIVTNIPAPYRNPIYSLISSKLGLDNFNVIFCAKKEPNRDWETNENGFSHTFSKENIHEKNGRYIHNNPDVWVLLKKLNPEVVITTGFNPTHLYAFFWALFHRKIHILMTDGTLESEAHLSFIHRFTRRFVYKFSAAYIGASEGSKRLYGSYNIPSHAFFQSHLCANNAAFLPHDITVRTYDFMFCGRFSAEKNPLFALDVARGVALKLGRKVSLLFVGSGRMLDAVKERANGYSAEVECVFKGFIQQSDLPKLYCDCKVFLFPTSWDPWGVVANEACAAGQAVIVSPHAGVAGELILHNNNGYVLPLILDSWVECATKILGDNDLLRQFSECSLQRVKDFSYSAAANGIISAVEFALATSTRKLALAPSALNTSDKKTVVIIQRRLCDYRVPLFNQLKTLLAADNIELRLLYGDGTPQEQTKGDSADIAWGEKLHTRYVIAERICWQPFYAQVRGADLVIVTQENKLVCNLWPLFSRRNYKLAFWGHGKNLQGLPTFWGKLKEYIKFFTTNRADWWFVYTDLSSELVEKLGFAKSKITNLENSIDTTNLKKLCAQVTNDDIATIRQKHTLGTWPVALFIGSLYQEKRLDFLLSVCQLISQKIPNFKLVIIGDGPQRALIQNALTQYPWLIYAGRQTDANKAQYLKTASVLLNPGLVGLGILDAFAAGIPIITTDCGLHSPEIDYLQNGENGFITANTVEAYVETVVQILTDPELAKYLQNGCITSANHYTVENMAQNFRAGILKALG